MSAITLTSLASLKRACTFGACLEIVESDRPWHQRSRAPRMIAVVQSNAIAMRGAVRDGEWDPERLSWLYWPKVSELAFHGDDTFTYSGVARYRVLPREA